MITFDIRLSSVDAVRRFVSITSASEADVDLERGNYLVDAKSIMGIFSLDLSVPVTVLIHDDGAPTAAAALAKALTDFRV